MWANDSFHLEHQRNDELNSSCPGFSSYELNHLDTAQRAAGKGAAKVSI